MSLTVLLALVAPLSVIAIWLWRGVLTSQGAIIDWLAVWNALSVSLATAFVATLAAVPVAVLAVRFPSRLSALLERLTYLGYALPGIVVALALVFFGARYAPVLYQTTTMLVFGYTVLFIPARHPAAD
jgi:iron(III) transport system permease protein